MPAADNGRLPWPDLILGKLNWTILGWLGNANIDSINYNIGMAEILRRQTKAQLEPSEAQIVAADAETKAAEAAMKSSIATERNATYMLWSVVIAAIAALASALSAALSAYSVWPKK
jgi:hypothetical protein